MARNMQSNKFQNELVSLSLLFLGAFILMSIFSYNQNDPGFNHSASANWKVQNLGGTVGSYIASFFVDFFGFGAYVFPFFVFFAGILNSIMNKEQEWWQWAALSGIYIVLIGWLDHPWFQAETISEKGIVGGGFVGLLLDTTFGKALQPTGYFLFLLFLSLFFIQLVSGFSWVEIFKKVRAFIQDMYLKYSEQIIRSSRVAARSPEKKSIIARIGAFFLIMQAKAEYRRTQSAEAKARWDAYSKGGLTAQGYAEQEEKVIIIDDDTDNSSTKKNSMRSVNGVHGTLSEEINNIDLKPIALESKVIDTESKIVFSGKAESFVANTEDLQIYSANSDFAKDINKDINNIDKGTDKEISKEFAKNENHRPSTKFLTEPKKDAFVTDDKNFIAQSELLLACLQDFGVQGLIQNIVAGPVVTLFEFKPAPGVKVSKISGLSDDIAMVLQAMSVRIEAPVPGRDVVGIEIPNIHPQMVYLREVFESQEFLQAESPLTLALGKDILGGIQVADLAKMPHLLIAGATGAGKSVCLNGIILSILYKANPEDVRLLLVDPKRIELAMYSELPHLVHPVVTEVDIAKKALEWAVFEMERRYKDLAKLGVRTFSAYNEKIEQMGDIRPENLENLEKLPYLVVIIDELADLMMTAAKEVEISIVRLAQKARAAGIHLIIATQRPSVDVVTGLIKANFPTRISFQVASKHDSRTVLDTSGAEQLLGRGDMLLKPSGSKLKRVHGAFVDEKEIDAVVDFWKEGREQHFLVDFTSWSNAEFVETHTKSASAVDDEVYDAVIEFVLLQGSGSTSLLQRRFGIGYNRAARIIDQLVADGILGQQEGNKPRAVLRKEGS